MNMDMERWEGVQESITAAALHVTILFSAPSVTMPLTLSMDAELLRHDCTLLLDCALWERARPATLYSCTRPCHLQ